MSYSLNKLPFFRICLACCFSILAYAQQPAEPSDLTSQGVSLYERGETDSAVKTLREAIRKSKKDTKAWHYLGLALVRQDKLKEARNAFEKEGDFQSRALHEAIGTREDREWSDEELLNLKALTSEKIENQKMLLQLASDKEALEKAQFILDRWTIEAECMEQNIKLVGGHSVLRRIDMGVKKPRVLSKPEPVFPNVERRGTVNATVVLRVFFATDGSIRHIEEIRSSGKEFTLEAVRAARQIKFQPASICGKPVNFPVQLEYSFSSGF